MTSASAITAKGGRNAASFLRLEHGARAAAMSGAYTALSEDATAIFWNPAGLANVRWKEIAASFQALPVGAGLGYAAYAMPVSRTAGLGIGVAYLHSGTLEGRDENDQPTSDFSVQNLQAAVGAGWRLTRTGVGGAIQVPWSKIADKNGASVAVSAGALHEIPFPAENPTHRLLLGFALQNFGPKIGPGRKAHLPWTIRLGIADQWVEHRLTVSAEALQVIRENPQAQVGLEWRFVDPVSVRVGYRFLRPKPAAAGFTAGIGISYSQRQDYLLDYALLPGGDLGLRHQASFTVRF